MMSSMTKYDSFRPANVTILGGYGNLPEHCSVD